LQNSQPVIKKNFLAGLDIPNFDALNPAARHWLDTIANVRLQGETLAKPTDLWHNERPALRVAVTSCSIVTGVVTSLVCNIRLARRISAVSISPSGARLSFPALM
jgi:hypothetical protein